MTQIFDLLGISVCSQQVLLPQNMLPPEMSMDELNHLYRPEHVQKAFGIEFVAPRYLALSGIPEPSVLNAMWIEAVLEHPSCYLWHRARVAQFLLGAHTGDVFYITHPGVDANDLGVSATPSAITRTVVEWVLSNSHSLITRVWIYLAIGTICLMVAIFFRFPHRDIAAAAYLSGAFYTLVSIPLVPAADLRYQLWTVVAMLAASISVISGVLKSPLKPRSGSQSTA
jgi:hypothetical protein